MVNYVGPKNSLGFRPILFRKLTIKNKRYAVVGHGEMTKKVLKIDKDGYVRYDGKRVKVGS